MKYMKWMTIVLAGLMVLLALGGSYLSAQEAGGALTAVAAGLAVVLAWLAAKLEKPVRLLALSIGVTAGVAAFAMAVFAKDTAVVARFVLILAMLLAIIWLVGNMIRRHLTERK